MSKTEHSPLPWHMEVMPTSIWIGSSRPDGNSFEQIIARFDYGKDFTEKANKTYLDNAQFIVTACNSYYDNQKAIAELVEALEKMPAVATTAFAAGMEERWKGSANRQEKLIDKYEAVLKDARALIAKHKAKP